MIDHNAKPTKRDIKQFLNRFRSTMLKCLSVTVKLATIACAALAFFTLIEMRTERVNAYRPEIVIAPEYFEGGLYEPDKFDISKNYIFMNYETSNPGEWFIRTSRTPDVTIPKSKLVEDEDYFWWSNKKREFDYTNTVYIEAPYLTLKNIGRGTAKDIQITLSIDWIEKSIDLLNKHCSEYDFLMEAFRNNTIRITYLGKDQAFEEYLCEYNGKMNEISLTYLSSDEESVIVDLPDFWDEVFATLFAQRIHEFVNMSLSDDPKYSSGFLMELPDLIVTIQYSDMQGIRYKQEEVIPWKSDFQYMRYETSEEEGDYSVDLHMSFYGDYIR